MSQSSRQDDAARAKKVKVKLDQVTEELKGALEEKLSQVPSMAALDAGAARLGAHMDGRFKRDTTAIAVNDLERDFMAAPDAEGRNKVLQKLAELSRTDESAQTKCLDVQKICLYIMACDRYLKHLTQAKANESPEGQGKIKAVKELKGTLIGDTTRESRLAAFKEKRDETREAIGKYRWDGTSVSSTILSLGAAAGSGLGIWNTTGTSFLKEMDEIDAMKKVHEPEDAPKSTALKK